MGFRIITTNINKMTIKEDAKKMVAEYEKILSSYNMSKAHRKMFAIECALKALEEIMRPLMYLPQKDGYGMDWREYYFKIKTQIEKLKT